MRSNSRGFTLVELTIYGGLAVGTLLAVFTVVVLALQSFLGSQNRIDSDDEFVRIESVLRRTFQQAVRVRRFDGALPLNNQPEGWIRNFNSATAPINNTELLALFHFESQKVRELRGVMQVDSDLRGAGLFYLRPRVVNGVETEGVIIMAHDRINAGPMNDRVRPRFGANSWAGRLSGIAIPNTGINTRYTGVDGPDPIPYPQNRIASFSVDVTIRFFVPTVPMNQRCYRTAAQCNAAGMSTGHDVTKRITINLRNNEFGLNPLTRRPERLLGPLYFFNPYGRGNLNALD